MARADLGVACEVLPRAEGAVPRDGQRRPPEGPRDDHVGHQPALAQVLVPVPVPASVSAWVESSPLRICAPDRGARTLRLRLGSAAGVFSRAGARLGLGSASVSGPSEARCAVSMVWG